MERFLEKMHFPIQRIQADNGAEIFAIKVQKYLVAQSIKFRPIKPGMPQLNGKVERSQKTDVGEFYATVDLGPPDLEEWLDEWQFFYN
jgi:transposase InsO family protein